jgi:CheY-like chemotaxis protein
MAEIFGGEGFLVAQADDGRTALELLHAAADFPSLIFLDMRMPDVCGTRFLEILGEELPAMAESVPVLLCSASTKLLPANARGPLRQVLEKPSGIDEILGKAHGLMNRDPGNNARLA